MPPVSAPQPFSVRRAVRIIDWRLVAAVGLPLWAFLIGVVVTHKARPSIAVAEDPLTAGPGDPPPTSAIVETIPAPREVVVRTEIVTVPVVVPFPTSGMPLGADTGGAADFKLPMSEVVSTDRCQTFDTKIRFHPGLPEAAEEAKGAKKMLLVLHISGNFDDPGFT
ncbi:hypothetical protein [Frigoriglobus tundricola]|uniref:Uncharacterized protein n=1 Tax=Frigoriglobus tundricola TaxID=2774151 RepID=A0A6M5YJJ0_9BACT|nr:hypothetical protein [Frigoriglobus tundricola]QJW93433.1 hypothetical protein FTUN_0939 [Frigoriglobus tundricola]